MTRTSVPCAAAVLVLAAVFLPGCSKQPATNNTAGSASQSDASPPPPLTPDVTRLTPNAPSGSAAFNPHSMAGGMPPGMPNPHASEKGGKENPHVTAAVEQAQKAEAALRANPNDPTLRRNTAQAVYQAGNLMMTQSTQPPKVKYPAALRYFRRAVELDPANKDAAAGRDLIEGIYKSMNLPIPK